MDVFKYVVIIKNKYIGSVLAAIKVVFILMLMFIITPSRGLSQIDPDSLKADSVRPIEGDTLLATIDSLSQVERDSTLAADAARDSPISDLIDYSARDSIDNDVITKKVYLYGDAVVTYGSITLKAERIVYDFESYTVHAEGVQDSLGNWTGLPQFVDGPSEFDARAMDYNFKTKQGYITLVETEIIEGNLTGKEVKTVEGGNVIYIRNGEYCPCADPNAKTRFKIGKIKVIKDDKIVTGPGYLAFYGVPTPLVFPFGFFPNSEKRQAGIVIPSYGNGQRQGYFLNDGGFYTPLGENADTKILGDIFSRGSWGLQNISRYTQKYRYDGNLNLQYNVLKQGDQELFTYQEARNFFVNWTHRQDMKARPNSNFSADINAGSSQNFQNNLNATQNDFLTNTFRSNIRYQRSFYDSPWNLALNAGHDQNSQTQNYNFTLPELAATRARTFPLDGLFNDNPKQAFYEKIGVTYSGNFRNTLQATESQLRLNNLDSLRNQFQNGVRHSASASTSLKVKAFSINPSFNYSERWHFETYGRSFDEDLLGYVRDTLQGFDRNGDWNFSTNVTTKVYGMFSFRGKKLQAIRHTMTPTVGYSYRPDFDRNIYGFFGPEGTLGSYSPYEGTLFGGPPSGRSGAINFSLVNNLEAKIASRRDTVNKFVKVPLIENIQVNGSYNMAADSLKLSNIALSGRTQITKYANINFRAAFNPYTFEAREGSRSPILVDEYNFNRNGQLASFENGNIALNAAGLGSSMFKGQKGIPTTPVEGLIPEESEMAETTADLDVKKPFFSDFTVPWSLNFGYVVDIRRGRETIMLDERLSIVDSIAITQTLMMNGNIEFFGRIRVNFNTGYDFVNKEISTTTFVVSVDLNCWELNARIVPFGLRQSYNLSLNIKSTLLKDLKFERNRNLGPDDNFFL